MEDSGCGHAPLIPLICGQKKPLGIGVGKEGPQRIVDRQFSMCPEVDRRLASISALLEALPLKSILAISPAFAPGFSFLVGVPPVQTFDGYWPVSDRIGLV